jgi:hypothetical protein
MMFAEHDGIWHIVGEGVTLCGAKAGEPVDLGGVEPKPLCWRCREVEAEQAGVR